MDFLLPLLPIALVGGANLWLGISQRRRRLRAWQDAAVASGLQVVGSPGWRHLSARAGPVTVKIETCGDKGRRTRIIVQVPGPPDFSSVGLHRESSLRRGQEIEIGDPSFDGTFFIEGPARLVLALLDAETRRLLIRVNAQSRLEISKGTLRAMHMLDKRVPHVLPLLLDAARRIAEPLDLLRRLTENANGDPEPGVRLQNLLLMIRQLPGNPWTVAALRTACTDPSPEIRLRAATELGTEARHVLLDLAESLVDDAVSARAVWVLDRELPAERVRAILDHALVWRRLQTARTCLEVLGRSRDAAAVDTLAQVPAHEGDLAVVAAQALGATGHPAAEPPLLLALQREDTRVAAAQALGRIGSVAAVLPLQEAAERAVLHPELRHAMRQAIAEIQSRLPGASPGQLSLMSSEAGQLSLAQAGTGQLSLADDAAGQLSLPSES